MALMNILDQLFRTRDQSTVTFISTGLFLFLLFFFLNCLFSFIVIYISDKIISLSYFVQFDLFSQPETEDKAHEGGDMEEIDSSHFRPDPLQYELCAVIGNTLTSKGLLMKSLLN